MSSARPEASGAGDLLRRRWIAAVLAHGQSAAEGWLTLLEAAGADAAASAGAGALGTAAGVPASDAGAPATAAGLTATAEAAPGADVAVSDAGAPATAARTPATAEGAPGADVAVSAAGAPATVAGTPATAEAAPGADVAVSDAGAPIMDAAVPDAAANPPLTTSLLRSWTAEMPIRTLAELAVSGHEVTAVLEKRPGPWLGVLLHRLLQAVAAGDIANDTQLLLQAAQRMDRDE
ncbi:hypothetical protein MHH28_10565 [Paenibacillus sp. FSL K6-1217]|uniref:hypothetical protein n=1 Tax=Paenibacillus sp. FSL K6-1217 TaxID=2921466 RepID=UPI00324ECDEF